MTVRLLDVNDHAPVFTQHFYDVRVPILPDAPPDDTLPQVYIFFVSTELFASKTFVMYVVASDSVTKVSVKSARQEFRSRTNSC